MIKRNMLRLLILCTLAAGWSASSHALDAEEVAAWREDLKFVRSELPVTHPDLYHVLGEEEFFESIASLDNELPSMEQYEVVVELAAIVASVNDGHTRLTLPMMEGSGFFSGHSSTPLPGDDALLLHYLPIRFALHDDGLFVSESGSEFAHVVGARVERIGQVTAQEAMERIARVLHHDNEWQIRSLMPSRLVVPEILHALRIAVGPEESTLVLRLVDGSEEQLILRPVAEGGSVEWVGTSANPPLYLRYPDKNFWFEHLPDAKAVFCQYNEVQGTNEESVAEFSNRLTTFIDQNGIETLVLDLRFNRGGDNSLNRAFLHAILRCDALREPGAFFVIIGRDTFSAAMMFALDLEKHTSAIFVGEPTGARPNHYGDSRKIQLPQSGLTIRVSSLYWQYAGPKDKRDSLQPHLHIRRTSWDARMGRDPVLEQILELSTLPPTGTPKGAWRGLALGYDMIVHVEHAEDGWSASLDIPTEGYSDLALSNVGFEAPAFRFDLPNGDDTVEFRATIHDRTLLGRVAHRDQVFPLVMIRE